MLPNPLASAGGHAEAVAGHTLHHRWVERVARVGILSRAVNYLVLGVLTVTVLLGHAATEVDRRGAVEAVASAPFGRVLLLLLCAGFAAYVAWQLLRAASRRGGEGRGQSVGRRLLALGTALVYLTFLVTTVRVVAGASTRSPQGEQDSWTAHLLSAPGGRVLVAAVGAGFIVAGIVLGVNAVRQRFESHLATGRMTPLVRAASRVLGVAGQMGRALLLAVIGGFIISAAASADPGQSKGMDAALRTLAGEPFGTLLLLVVAGGFVAFGLYSLIDARYREDFTR